MAGVDGQHRVGGQVGQKLKRSSKGECFELGAEPCVVSPFEELVGCSIGVGEKPGERFDGEQSAGVDVDDRLCDEEDRLAGQRVVGLLAGGVVASGGRGDDLCGEAAGPFGVGAAAVLRRIAEELGFDLVGTGIDTNAELDTLRRLGIPRGRGLAVGSPWAFAEMAAGEPLM